MTATYQLHTQRLCLRQWVESDYPAFAAINHSPIVMEYFPALLSRQESDELARAIAATLATQGWGLWAVEYRADSSFIGFVGLNRQTGMPFGDCIEIAWRLDSNYWGQGLATEAANAVLEFAFTELALPEVLAFTAAINSRSEALIRRIGLVNRQANFDHPKVDRDSPLCDHVLYGLTREQFQARQDRRSCLVDVTRG